MRVAVNRPVGMTRANGALRSLGRLMSTPEPPRVPLELIATVLVVGGLGGIGLLVWAGSTGLWAFLAVGVVLAVVVGAIVIVGMRRPRGAIAAGDMRPFEMPSRPAGSQTPRTLVVADRAVTAEDAGRLA